MGADHTAGYAVTANVLGVGGKVDPLSPDGQVELSRNLQIATAAIDTSGLCLFVAFAVLDDPAALEGICEMLAASTAAPSPPTISWRWAGGRWLSSGASTPRPASRRPTTGCPTSSARKSCRRTTSRSRCRTKSWTGFCRDWVGTVHEQSPRVRLCRVAPVHRRLGGGGGRGRRREAPSPRCWLNWGFLPSGRKSCSSTAARRNWTVALADGERVDLFSAIGGG